MGGRGSAGGPGGSGGSRSFSAPTMSGSEKQVSWAKDIIETPYKNLGLRADGAATIARRLEAGGGRADDYRAEESAYRAAQARYAEGMNSMARNTQGGLKASQVIERRGMFQQAANELAEEELRKRRR